MSAPDRHGESFAESRQRQREQFLREATNYHGGRRAFLSILLAVSLFFAIGALAARQVTGASAARTVLAAGISRISDLNQLMAEDANLRAASGASANLPAVPGFPIDTGLTRADVAGKSPAQVRELLLDRGAGAIYSFGTRAFDRTGSQAVTRFSGTGLLVTLAGQITASNHGRASLALFVFGATTALLAGAVLISAEPGRRVRTVALPVLAAGLAGLIATGAGWLVVGQLGSSDSFGSGMRSIAHAVVEVPLRDYLIILALGIAMLAVAPLVRMVARRLGTAERTAPDALGPVAVNILDDAYDADEEEAAEVEAGV